MIQEDVQLMALQYVLKVLDGKVYRAFSSRDQNEVKIVL